jgi:uncharacterized protein YeaO (DUF488 family)
MAGNAERIAVKRVCDERAPEDGMRVLVDRLWPRGLSRERARLDLWLREVAPSDELRRWYGHDPARWEEFWRRYQRELSGGPQAEALAWLRELARQGPITLVFGARDAEHANAAVLLGLLAQ